MTRPRRRRGLTLPELLAVALLVGVAASAVVAIPAVGRDRAHTYQAAAALEAAVNAAAAVWDTAGQLPPETDTVNGQPAVLSAMGRHVPDLQLLNAGQRDTADGPAPSRAQVLPGQAAETISVAWIAGRDAAAIAVATRSVSGDCLLTRVDLGDRAGPQRYGLIPTGLAGVPPCQGDVAMSLPFVDDPTRAGASWANPTRITSPTGQTGGE